MELGSQLNSWARFSRYEIRDGYIRPVDQAALEVYTLSPDLREPDGRTAYESLAEVVQSGRRTVTGALTEETEAALVCWCQRFGLLGVLLQQVHTVVFPPQVVPDDDPGWAGVNRQRLLRTSSGWQLLSDTEIDEGLASAGDGYVLLRPLVGSEVTSEDITKTWGTFFPSIPPEARSRYPYPHPADERFFRIYAEPIDMFFHAADLLTGALDTVAVAKATKPTKSGLSSTFAEAVHTLSELAGQAGTSFVPMKDGAVCESWVSPSLLAVLARMALRDLSVGQSVRVCENRSCQKLYTSAAYQSRYCSARCRQTVNKRAVRRAARAKRSKAPKRRMRSVGAPKLK